MEQVMGVTSDADIDATETEREAEAVSCCG